MQDKPRLGGELEAFLSASGSNGSTFHNHKLTQERGS